MAKITKTKIQRFTTKQLKIAIENLTIGQALAVVLRKTDSEQFKRMSERQEVLEKEFYSRRNHKDYLKGGKYAKK